MSPVDTSPEALAAEALAAAKITLDDLWSDIPRTDRHGTPLTDWHAQVIYGLCKALMTKPWHNRLAWHLQEAGPGRYSVSTISDLATHDGNELTGLVLLAHERCWRISVVPHGPRRMLIQVHQRDPEQRGIGRGHPTLERAVAAWRARG